MIHCGFLLFLTFLAGTLWAQVPDLLVQSGHTNRITCGDVSDDNHYLATGSHDNLIKIWDLTNGKLLRQLANGEAPNDLDFQNGRHNLISGSWGIDSESMKYWDMDSGEQNALPFPTGVMDISQSHSGKYLAVAGTKGVIAFWDMERNKGLWYYSTGTDATVNAMAFSPDEQWLAVTDGGWGESNHLYIWPTDTNIVEKRIPLEGRVQRLFFLSGDILMMEVTQFHKSNEIYKVHLEDGRVEKFTDLNQFVVTGDRKHIVGMAEEYTLHVLDALTGALLYKIPVQENSIDDLLITSDDATIIALGRHIESVDLASGKSNFFIRGKNWIDAMTFSAKGNNLAFSGSEGAIIRWDVEHGDVDLWEGHTANVMDLFYDRDGKYLASASADTTVIIWNQDGSKKHWFGFDTNDFHTVSMNPSADWLAVSNGDTVYSIEVERGVLGAKFSFGDIPVDKVIYSPNNRDCGYIISSNLLVYDIIDERTRLNLSLGDAGLSDLSFSADGRFIATGGYADSIIVYDLDQEKIAFSYPEDGDYVTSLAIDPTSSLLAVGYSSGLLKLFDYLKGTKVAEFREHANLVNKLSFRQDGKVLASSSWDGKLVLWDVQQRSKLGELYAFEDGSWAIIDDHGRYDASNAGNIDHLHFVVEMEAIGLDQLKERFYEPMLLQKLLGYRTEPLRDVSALSNVGLFPKVAAQLEGTDLAVSVHSRSGGVGRIALFINEKEVREDLSGTLQPTADSLTSILQVKLMDYERYLINGRNEIALQAYNAEGYLSSQRIPVVYEYAPPAPAQNNGFAALARPKLFAVVVGTSDYRGNALDLQFADKDALSFSGALEQVATSLYGEGQVDIQTYFTGSTEKLPTKRQIETGFRRISELARPMDVLVVYMSGHGVNHQKGDNNQFHYLTMEVESGDLSDEAIREEYTISTEELTDWIKSIPVQKQVLILDACASGRAIEDILVAQKSVSSGQIRALERLKDRTGMFVLVGSAADKVSFEASRFGQSLLTYSLLEGMKGQALREGEFVDVLTLFDHSVEKVPELANYIGGIQKPILAVPYGGKSFDIGRVDEHVHIDLAEIKPVFIRSNFQDEYEYADIMGLSEMIDAQFRDKAARPKSAEVIFVDVTNYPDAYSIKGRYLVEGATVTATARIFKNKEVTGTFTVEGPSDDIAGFARMVIEKAESFLTE